MVARALFPECCACKLIDNWSSLSKCMFPHMTNEAAWHREVKSITSGEVLHVRKMEERVVALRPLYMAYYDGIEGSME